MKILVLVTAISLVGCGTHQIQTSSLNNTTKISTAEIARATQTKVVGATDEVIKLSDTINLMTPENIAVQKPIAQAQASDVTTKLTSIESQISTLITSINSDAIATAAIVEKDKKLTTSQTIAQQHSLNECGMWFLIPSIIILLTTFFLGSVAFLEAFLNTIRMGAILGIITGITFLTLSAFLITIELVFLILGGVIIFGLVCFLIYYVWEHHTTLTNVTNLLGGPVVVASARPPDKIV